MTRNSKAAPIAVCAALISALALALLAACGSSAEPSQPMPAQSAAPAPAAMPMASGGPAAAVPPSTPMPAQSAAPAPTAMPADAQPAPSPAPSWPVPTAAPIPTATPIPQAPEPEDGDGDGDGHDHENGGSGMPPATMTKLADGVYHYFSFFYGSLIVVGEDEVLITDPSNFPRAQGMKAAIAELTDAPVTTIVLTHEHYDHAGGTGVFPDAKVVCHRNCDPIFALHPSRTDPDKAIPALGGVPAKVDEAFDDFKEIRVGDVAVELRYMGPGDGDATTIIWLPNEKIAATADLYTRRSLTNAAFVDDKNFTGVRSILNAMSEWDIEHAIDGHSPETDPSNLRENAEYYNDLYDAVKPEVDAAIAAAGGAAFGAYGLFDTLPQTLRLEKYADWGNYDSALPKHVERMLLAIYHGD